MQKCARSAFLHFHAIRVCVLLGRVSALQESALNCLIHIAYVFIYLIAFVFIHHVMRVIAGAIDCLFWTTEKVWLCPNAE